MSKQSNNPPNSVVWKPAIESKMSGINEQIIMAVLVLGGNFFLYHLMFQWLRTFELTDNKQINMRKFKIYLKGQPGVSQ